MRLNRPPYLIIGIVTALSLSAPLSAYGYIDPGTGSQIIQGIIGAIAAIGVTLKIYWHKVKVFLSGGSKEDQKKTNPSQDSVDTRR